MQNSGSLKFLIQPSVSDPDIHICYDYYCPPTVQNNTLLEHIEKPALKKLVKAIIVEGRNKQIDFYKLFIQ